MPGKNCRHVRQALHLSEFRRALKNRALFACESCATPSTSRNHRGSGSGASGSGSGGGSSSRRGGKALVLTPPPGDVELATAECVPLSALQSWESREHWGDLCVCVTCGFIGCFSSGHFSAHFQVNPKHFVGFQAGSKTFWCSPCKMEVADSSKSKVEDNRRECETVFEDMVLKRVRQLRTQAQVANASGRLSSGAPSNGNADNRAINSQEPEDDGYSGDLDSQRSNTGATDQRQADRNPDRNGASGDEGLQRGGRGLPAEAEMSPGTSSARGNAVELLNMPMRSKGRDERARRRLMKSSPPSPKPMEQEEEAASSTASSGTPPTVLGFTNLGNTCYFNASVQALLTATHFFPEHTHIKDTLEMADIPILNTLTMLHETVKKRARRTLAEASAVKEGKPKPQEPTSRRHDNSRSRSKSSSVLTVAPLLKEMRKKFAQFRGDYQQDAHELFTSLLWAIDEETDPPSPVANGSDASTSVSSATTVNADDDDGSDESSDEGTKQLFVKTETGETISMQVPKSATLEEVQRLLAKRLNLNEDDMMLQGSRESIRASMPRMSRVGKTHSKLNLARNLFGGALTTAVTCQACGNRTDTVEDAFIVSMSIPDISFGQTLTIADCLRGFVRETRLLVDSNNGYDCERCSRQPKKQTRSSPFARKKKRADETELILRDATMRVFVSELPKVLAVHLKRLGRTKKITHHIVFDTKLDMLPYVASSVQRNDKAGSARYELIAVVVHMGGKRGGHYVAYVSRSPSRELGSRRHKQQPQDSEGEQSANGDGGRGDARVWYYVSDTLVKRVELEQVLKCEAYMLFYQQLPVGQ